MVEQPNPTGQRPIRLGYREGEIYGVAKRRINNQHSTKRHRPRCDVSKVNRWGKGNSPQASSQTCFARQ